MLMLDPIAVFMVIGLVVGVVTGLRNLFRHLDARVQAYRAAGEELLATIAEYPPDYRAHLEPVVLSARLNLRQRLNMICCLRENLARLHATEKYRP
jgi:hypothetical protein